MLVKELIDLLKEENPEAEVGSLIVAVREGKPVAISVASKFTMGVTSYPKDNKVFITGQNDVDHFVGTAYAPKDTNEVLEQFKS